MRDSWWEESHAPSDELPPLLSFPLSDAPLRDCLTHRYGMRMLG